MNLVEIDLLRSGQRMPLSDAPPPSDYRILVFRPRPFRIAEVYGFSYKDPIPPIPIPLLPREAEPSLDLNSILHALHRAGGLRSEHRLPPTAPSAPA